MERRAGQRILIVEDNEEVSSALERVLTRQGFEVRVAPDGDSGIAATHDFAPELVVLDVGLPKRSGFEVVRDLRRLGYVAPVLMLTGYDTITDKIQGLESGADDYLAKPFDFQEFVARVRALLRRASMQTERTRLAVEDLEIDLIDRSVRRSGTPIDLTQKEFALLEFLARNKGVPVTREQITQHVWKQEFDPQTNIIDVYVNYLRKKIEGGTYSQLLHTVRGVGYVLGNAD